MAKPTEEALIVRMEASLAKFERQMRQGTQVADKEATAVERRLARMGSTVATSADRAGQGLTRMFSASRQGNFVLQNTAYQISDVAVQIQGGTSAFRALGQQLPQFFGGFAALGGTLGTLGPLLGTVAAVALPAVALAMGGLADQSKALDKAVEELEGKMNALKAANDAVGMSSDELADKFGATASEVRGTLALLQQLAANEAQRSVDALSQSLSDLMSIAGDGDRRTGIAEFFDVNIFLAFTDAQREARAEAREMTAEFANWQAALANANGDIDAQVEALSGMLSAAQGLADLSGDRSAEEEKLIKQLADSLLIMQQTRGEAEQVQTVFSNIVNIVDLVSSGIDAARSATDAAAASAGTWASQLAVAAQNAYATMYAMAQARREQATREREIATMQNQYAQYGAGQIAQRQQEADQRYSVDGRAPTYTPPRTSSGRSSGGGGGRSGGGGKSYSATDIIESAQQEIALLEHKISLIGLEGQALATAEAKYKLIEEAKRRNLDLDQRTADGSRTLREEIDAQAEAIGNLTTQYEAAQERAQFLEQANESLQDSFLDAIVEGENLTGVLADLAKQMAKAALQAALFGTGPMASGGGSGLLGNVFGTLTGAMFGSAPSVPTVNTSSIAAVGKTAAQAITLNVTSDPSVIVSVAEATADTKIKQNNAVRDRAFNGKARSAMANTRKV